MLGLKKQLIKSYINIKVVQNLPGALTLKISNLSKIGDQYKGYDVQVFELIKMLEGISDIKVDFNSELATVYYDQTKLTPQQILKWLNVVIDTTIDQLDLISKYWETNTDYVVQTMSDLLNKKLKLYF
ncbi:MAG: heavy-metal-associated domain-containing protein [Cellulosilyticaceae bacterium]